MYDSIIFDLDGTLWDSTDEVAISFRETLKAKYPQVTDEVTSERLKSLFGLPLDEIAVKLYQSVPTDDAIRIMKECCDDECAYLVQHGAKLYAHLEETLIELAKKYKLYIVSNCQAGYIECFFGANPSLEQYFIDHECPGRSGKLKAENIRLVVERNQLSNPIYVGDTLGDATAAKKAGVPFLYARYGFGSVDEYNYVVDTFADIPKVLENNEG